MPLLPYALARPFLFSMDAEAAHDLTMKSLALTQHSPLKMAYCAGRVEDPIELAGLKFPNRVGMAAGLDKNARCIDGLAAMGFGFVEVGTVTPLPQAGNPKPRMFRLPEAHALINRLGFNNEGLDAFLRHVRASTFRQQSNGKLPLLLGLNIGKNAVTPTRTLSMTTWLAWTASTRRLTMSPSTSPARTPKICVPCKAMKRWTRCWALLPNVARSSSKRTVKPSRFL